MKTMVLLAMLALSPALSAAPAPATSTGIWKIDGDVMGTPVNMMCTLAEADHKLTGACTGATDAPSRKLTGEVKEGTVMWHFDTEYQGTPITISFSGKLSDDGTKMNGLMSIAPMDVDGTFSAIRQDPAAAPPASGN